MSQPLILWILASVIVGLICAVTLGNLWRHRRPDKKPYTWGCFYGGHLLCYWALCFVYPVEPEKEGIYIYYWGMTACGFGVLLRREAAWLLSTFGTINPILWIINFAYFDERKAEMTAERQAREEAEKRYQASRKAMNSQPTPLPEPEALPKQQLAPKNQDSPLIAIWRWITQPIRFVGLVLLIVGSAWLIRDTLTTRYEYRSISGNMLRIDTWTGREWYRSGTGWRLMTPP